MRHIITTYYYMRQQQEQGLASETPLSKYITAQHPQGENRCHVGVAKIVVNINCLAKIVVKYSPSGCSYSKR